MSDLTYAVRSLARSRGFTVAAILTLSIGIGATTAIYSVVDTILLQPLPFPDSDRLVRVIENAPPFAPGRPIVQRGITHQEFLDWRTRTKTLTDPAAVVGMSQRMVKTPDGAAGLWGAMVSSNPFALLQVNAALDARSGRVTMPILTSSCSVTTPGKRTSMAIRKSSARRSSFAPARCSHPFRRGCSQ